MALNIPVNLMNAAVPQTQSIPAANKSGISTTVQPVSASASTRDTASDASADRNTTPNAVSDWGMSTATPSPASLDRSTPVPYGTELDRYAPPNPLPTAPILKAAASYAANKEDL